MIIVRTLFMARIAIFIFPVDFTHSALASLSLNMLTVQLRWCFLDSLTITFPFFTKLIHPVSAALVTQPKGQLISKCLLGVIVSTKKPTKFL